MIHPNFDEMSRKELLAYLLEHRDDEAVFFAYMDRLNTEPVLHRGTPEELRDPDRFAAILEKVRRIKQGLEPSEG